jgi:DNA-binding NarL/FixJ family response regulator
MHSDETGEIPAQLKRITKLLLIIATKDQKQREQIEILSRTGFQPKEIADLLGTTPNNVSVTLSDIRRKKR